MDADESVNEELNISQISFSSWHYSTPMKDRGTTSPLSITRASLRSSTKKKSPYVVTQVQKAAHVRKTKQKATFKVPEVFYKCPHCPKKKYKTQRYYNEHMLVHKVQGMFGLSVSKVMLREVHYVAYNIYVWLTITDCFQMPVLASLAWKNCF